MGENLTDKIKALQKEVHAIMCNYLTYPKSVLGVLEEKKLTEDQVARGVDCIDDCIKRVDSKLAEFLMHVEGNEPDERGPDGAGPD